MLLSLTDLHAKGRKVIGYINVGSWEDWRPDKDQFPPEVSGQRLRRLDRRKVAGYSPDGYARAHHAARLDLCKAKGFDAVEPDNMEIHSNGRVSQSHMMTS